MNKILSFFTTVAMSALLISSCCTRDCPDSSITQNYLQNEYEIPLEDALETLSVFLDSGNQPTKSSLLDKGEISVSKWTCPGVVTKTKSDDNLSSVYCVAFSNNNGGAVLAADSRISDKIICVTETEISTEDLDNAWNQLEAISSDRKFSGNTKEEFLNSFESAQINGCDESFAAMVVCNDIACLPKEVEKNVTPKTTIYGPLLETKWRQRAPFNDNMSGTVAGCGPVAAAQVIYYFRDRVKDRETWAWDWNLLKNVSPYSNPSNYNNCSPDENLAAANFMSEVKYRCNMKPTETGCVVGDIKKCLRSFGFENVKHDFAASGGSDHDVRHYDSTYDSGSSDTSMGNFNLFHYYVYYE